MKYPRVRDEWETLLQLQAGKSIGRFGDGELKMSHGNSYRRQIGSARLADELREVLHRANDQCIVGIPTMDPKGPKFANWDRHRKRFEQTLKGTTLPIYYSAFITRPDSAPSIFCPAFAEGMRELWAGKRTAILCEPDSKMLKVLQLGAAAAVTHFECPTYQAYDSIDTFEQQLLRSGSQIVFMSCGPSATCLANRLSRQGLQAIDIGSAGGFLLKLLMGVAG